MKRIVKQLLVDQITRLQEAQVAKLQACAPQRLLWVGDTTVHGVRACTYSVRIVYTQVNAHVGRGHQRAPCPCEEGAGMRRSTYDDHTHVNFRQNVHASRVTVQCAWRNLVVVLVGLCCKPTSQRCRSRATLESMMNYLSLDYHQHFLVVFALDSQLW